MKEKIIRYLKDTYHPRALMVYGSYQRGDWDEYSDFDCMIIVDGKEKKHDETVFDGVPLDCFIFTVKETEQEDPDTFLTAYDSEIVLDDGTGAALQRRVREYVRAHTVTAPEDKAFIRAWYLKSLHRMEKNDDEGNYRAAALLGESLADYFLLRDMFYFGSKKGIACLKADDPAGYALFHEAVTRRERTGITAWAEYVIASQT